MRLQDFEAMSASGHARRGGLCGDISPTCPLTAPLLCTRAAGHESHVHEARSTTGALYAQWWPVVLCHALGGR